MKPKGARLHIHIWNTFVILCLNDGPNSLTEGEIVSLEIFKQKEENTWQKYYTYVSS